MKLNIQWPEERKWDEDRAMTINKGSDNYKMGVNDGIKLCKQAVEKAIKDTEKDASADNNEDIILRNVPCDVCGKIHTQFPSSCRPSTKISFYGKIKDTEKEGK